MPVAQQVGLPATGAHPFWPAPHRSHVPLAGSVQLQPSGQQVEPHTRSGAQQTPTTHGPLQHCPLQQPWSGAQQLPPQAWLGGAQQLLPLRQYWGSQQLPPHSESGRQQTPALHVSSAPQQVLPHAGPVFPGGHTLQTIRSGSMLGDEQRWPSGQQRKPQPSPPFGQQRLVAASAQKLPFVPPQQKLPHPVPPFGQHSFLSGSPHVFPGPQQ